VLCGASEVPVGIGGGDLRLDKSFLEVGRFGIEGAGDVFRSRGTRGGDLLLGRLGGNVAGGGGFDEGRGGGSLPPGRVFDWLIMS